LHFGLSIRGINSCYGETFNAQSSMLSDRAGILVVQVGRQHRDAVEESIDRPVFIAVMNLSGCR
jgi:hypothetical protein